MLLGLRRPIVSVPLPTRVSNRGEAEREVSWLVELVKNMAKTGRQRCAKFLTQLTSQANPSDWRSVGESGVEGLLGKFIHMKTKE